MKIDKKDYFKILIDEIIFFVLVFGIAFYFNLKIWIPGLFLGSIMTVIFYFLNRSFKEYRTKLSEKRFQEIKTRIERSMHPLYFINPTFMIFVQIFAFIVILLFVSSIASVLLESFKQLAPYFFFSFLMTSMILTIGLTIYFLNKSKRIPYIKFAFLGTAMILLFLSILLIETPIIKLIPLLIFVISSMAIILFSSGYVIYVKKKYISPGLIYQKRMK